MRCEVEKRKNGNDHTKQAQEDEAANEYAAPCHGVTSFIVLANGVEGNDAIDQRAQTDKGTKGNADKTCKGNRNQDSTAEEEESHQP